MSNGMYDGWAANREVRTRDITDYKDREIYMELKRRLALKKTKLDKRSLRSLYNKISDYLFLGGI